MKSLILAGLVAGGLMAAATAPAQAIGPVQSDGLVPSHVEKTMTAAKRRRLIMMNTIQQQQMYGYRRRGYGGYGAYPPPPPVYPRRPRPFY